MIRQVLARLSVTLLVTAKLSTIAQAGPLTLTSERVVPDAVVVIYDPADGNLSVESNGRRMTTVEIMSNGSLFDPTKVNEGVIVGPFDLINSAKFFKLVTPPGFANVDIGPVFPSGLSADALLDDLQIDGSLSPSCDLGCHLLPGPQLFVVPVPEPFGRALIVCGLVGFLCVRCPTLLRSSVSLRR
jgi:hypothetical protein